MVKVFTVCSGIGGAELGLANSNFDNEEIEIIGYSEIDKYAAGIYQKHFPDHFNYGDITKINEEELPDFDLMIGGFPCQAFSIAGYRKGFDDTRGTIFFDIARIMKEKKPKYALFENVKGLLSHDKGNTFQVILNTLDELGYDVSWNVLNSKHFGVPQNRERIYLRCHLREDGEDLLPDIRININNKQNGNLIKKDVVNKVRKRVYEVPEKELKNLLISAKRSSKLTTKQIANNLNEPLTKVEHYFRRDSSFSIPNENIWFDLKKILQIDTDEFDKAITTFEVVDGVYDSSNRVYDDEGISPTITTDAGSLIYTHKGSRQGENVYSEDGIAPTITASGGNCGSRTFISKDAGDLIYTHKGKHQGSNIYSKDGISPTLTATDSKHPKYIQLNDASINKLNGSGPQGTRIYDSDGLAVTQAANGGGLGAKTGLYKIKQSNDKDDKQNKGEGLKVSTATKKGYDEVYPGDGIRLDHPGSSTGRGRTQKESTGALTCSTNWGTVDDDFRVRRLIPLECERLQGFPMINLEVDIWLSDQARKNVQYVVEKCLREQKPVGNVEKDKLQKNVLSVEKNSQVKNQKTNKLAPKSVHINYEGKKIQLHNLEKLKSDAKIVEKSDGYLLHIEQENFARLIVGMNTIVEKIIQCGKEELVQNEQWQIHQENGKLVVKLSGNEMTPLVNFVEKDSVMINKLMKFITSDPSSMKTQDMMLTTLYCYVIGVIIGSIPVKINTDYLEKINLQISTGWTEKGIIDDKEVDISDTQRYKCCGNAFTTSVITYILNSFYDYDQS